MLGWLANTKDERDWSFETALTTDKIGAGSSKPSVRAYWPEPRYLQYNFNMCVAEAFLNNWRTRLLVKGESDFEPSESQVYWNGRRQSGKVLNLHKKDIGCFPRDLVKAAQHLGFAPDALWPKRPSTINEPPSIEAVVAGIGVEFDYYWIGIENRVELMREALRAGYPVALGTLVHNGWYTYPGVASGIELAPPKNPNPFAGHYVSVGEILDNGAAWIRNWWDWGEGLLSRATVESPYTSDILVLV